MAVITGDCSTGVGVTLVPDDVNDIIPPGYLDNGSLPLETVNVDLGIVPGGGVAITGECVDQTNPCTEYWCLDDGCPPGCQLIPEFPTSPPMFNTCEETLTEYDYHLDQSIKAIHGSDYHMVYNTYSDNPYSFEVREPDNTYMFTVRGNENPADPSGIYMYRFGVYNEITNSFVFMFQHSGVSVVTILLIENVAGFPRTIINLGDSGITSVDSATCLVLTPTHYIIAGLGIISGSKVGATFFFHRNDFTFDGIISGTSADYYDNYHTTNGTIAVKSSFGYDIRVYKQGEASYSIYAEYIAATPGQTERKVLVTDLSNEGGPAMFAIHMETFTSGDDGNKYVVFYDLNFNIIKSIKSPLGESSYFGMQMSCYGNFIYIGDRQFKHVHVYNHDLDYLISYNLNAHNLVNRNYGYGILVNANYMYTGTYQQFGTEQQAYQKCTMVQI